MAQELRTVHLVHSDSDVLLSLYEVLSASGFQVAASSNALDGLAYIERSKPRAVLCRWEMPEMDGPEFIRRARIMSTDTRVIICSRNTDAERYRHIISLGASDLIMEPFSATAVRDAMMRSMGMGVPDEPIGKAIAFDLDSTLLAGRNGETNG